MNRNLAHFPLHDRLTKRTGEDTDAKDRPPRKGSEHAYAHVFPFPTALYEQTYHGALELTQRIGKLRRSGSGGSTDS